MNSQGFQPLDPSIILQMLRGTKSHGDEIGKKDQEARDAILRKQCPDCTGDLIPRVPKDPTKAFTPTGLNYEGWCPRCQRTVPVSSS